jgi:hypothetical protein
MRADRRRPAPGTNVTVHLLLGDGRQPAVTAQLGEAADQPILYLRLQADDTPRHGTRHAVDVSISGPPADIAALVIAIDAEVQRAQGEPS